MIIGIHQAFYQACRYATLARRTKELDEPKQKRVRTANGRATKAQTRLAMSKPHPPSRCRLSPSAIQGAKVRRGAVRNGRSHRYFAKGE
jgi:hypothetical protein